MQANDFIVTAEIGASWAIPFAVACTAYAVALGFRRRRQYQYALQPPIVPFRTWLLVHIFLITFIWLCALGGLWLLDRGTNAETESAEALDSLWIFSGPDLIALAEITFTLAVAYAAIGFVGRPIIEKLFARPASAQAPKGPPAPRTRFRPPLWLQDLVRRQKVAAAIVFVIVGSTVPTGLMENPTTAELLFGGGGPPVAHTQEKLQAPTKIEGLNTGQLLHIAEFLVRAITAALIGMMIVGPVIAWYFAPMNPSPFTRWEYRFMYVAMALGNLGLRYALEADAITPLLRIIVTGESSA